MPPRMERASDQDIAGMRETAAALSAFAGRGAGTDAERRAALWLLGRAREASGRRPRLEVHWVRPQRAVMLALHAVLAVGASLLSVGAPEAATAVLAVTALSLAVDLAGRPGPGRRLTPERATQHVIAPPADAGPPVLLVLAAATDVPRGGALRGPLVGRAAALARRWGLARGPSPAAWLLLAVLAILACSIARTAGADPSWLGGVQLVPTVSLLPVFGLLVDAALTPYGPGANGDASAVALALALTAALREAPPRNLAVELALHGASAGTGLGARAYVGRRRGADPGRIVLLELKPCGRGRPHWWCSDGELFPLALHPRLRELAAGVADARPELGARPWHGRGAGAALAARERGWAAIAVGTLDADGAVPGLATAGDVPERLDDISLRASYELALELVRAIDNDVSPSGRRDRRPPGDVTQG
jgi:hypothetical protein